MAINSQQQSFKSLEDVFQLYFIQGKVTKNMKNDILLIKKAQERVKILSESSKENKEHEQQTNAEHRKSEVIYKPSKKNNSDHEATSSLNESTNTSLVSYWDCQFCTSQNREEVFVCTTCAKTNDQLKKKIENQWSCLHCTTINPNDRYICQSCSKSDDLMKTKIENANGAVSKSKNQLMTKDESIYPSLAHITDYENGENDPFESKDLPTKSRNENFRQNICNPSINRFRTNDDLAFINPSMKTGNNEIPGKIPENQENFGQLPSYAFTAKRGFLSMLFNNIIGYLTGSKNKKAQQIETTFKEIIENNSWETLDEEIKKIYRRLVAKGLPVDENEDGYQLAVLKYIMPNIDDNFVIYVYTGQNFQIEATLKELLKVLVST